MQINVDGFKEEERIVVDFTPDEGFRDWAVLQSDCYSLLKFCKDTPPGERMLVSHMTLEFCQKLMREIYRMYDKDFSEVEELICM